jgi:hypothetical protein
MGIRYRSRYALAPTSSIRMSPRAARSEEVRLGRSQTCTARPPDGRWPAFCPLPQTSPTIKDGPVNVRKDHPTPDGGALGYVLKHGIDDASRQVMRDALANEESLGAPSIPRAEHNRVQRVPTEIDRDKGDVWWECPESSRDSVLLLGLGQWMVHFKDTGSLDSRDSIGSAVEPSSEDHDLLHTHPESFTEDIIDVPGTNHHRSP